jgi:rhodanese-related sulfurtransferase
MHKNHRITAPEAREIMQKNPAAIILDVRTDREYATGKIPGAKLMPDYTICERAETELPDKDALILVYCRSGTRSREAAYELISMGYTNVYDFGGINAWPYERA